MHGSKVLSLLNLLESWNLLTSLVATAFLGELRVFRRKNAEDTGSRDRCAGDLLVEGLLSELRIWDFILLTVL
jgi:hypothetical protein